jgi:hypothetical protein
MMPHGSATVADVERVGRDRRVTVALTPTIVSITNSVLRIAAV